MPMSMVTISNCAGHAQARPLHTAMLFPVQNRWRMWPPDSAKVKHFSSAQHRHATHPTCEPTFDIKAHGWEHKPVAGSHVPCSAYLCGAPVNRCCQDGLVLRPWSVHQPDHQLQVLLYIQEARLLPNTSWASHSWQLVEGWSEWRFHAHPLTSHTFAQVQTVWPAQWHRHTMSGRSHAQPQPSRTSVKSTERNSKG